MGKTRIWRVDTIHVNGYCAPHMLIETDLERLCKAEAEALNLAKIRSRFTGLPTWRFEVTLLDKKVFRGKYYSQDEYYRLSGR